MHSCTGMTVKMPMKRLVELVEPCSHLQRTPGIPLPLPLKKGSCPTAEHRPSCICRDEPQSRAVVTDSCSILVLEEGMVGSCLGLLCSSWHGLRSAAAAAAPDTKQPVSRAGQDLQGLAIYKQAPALPDKPVKPPDITYLLTDAGCTGPRARMVA